MTPTRSEMRTFIFSPLVAVLLFTGCATQRAEIKSWWGANGKADLKATAALVAQEAQTIAENDVFSNAASAEDAILKQNNVEGFASAGHELEAALPSLAIAQIPDFVMKLRDIWLGPQNHYTKLAADVGTLIENNLQSEQTKLGRPLLPAEANQIVEGVIQGLSTATPAAVSGP